MKDSVENYFVLTTNRLRDGAVVYMTKTEKELGWTTDIKQASVFTTSVIDRMIRLAQRDIDDNIVLDVYAAEVMDNHRPLGTRERIRAMGGPTVDFGTDKMDASSPDYEI